MAAVDPQLGKVCNHRRSQRVCVSVDVIVVSQGADKKPVSEDTHTVIVNAHGALILLRTVVTMGQLLTLKNVSTQEGLSCRVVDLNSNDSGGTEVGVEFTEPNPRFWHIAFPPLDWTIRSPEARGYTPRTPPPQKSRL